MSTTDPLAFAREALDTVQRLRGLLSCANSLNDLIEVAAGLEVIDAYVRAVLEANSPATELARLREVMQVIADEAAETTVRFCCVPAPERGPRYWSQPFSPRRECADRAIEYLVLRGLLERHGNLVRFVEPQS